MNFVKTSLLLKSFMIIAVLAAATLTNAQTYKVLKNFGVLTTAAGANPAAQLAQGPDGTLYGTTSGGASPVNGAVFKVQPDGSGFTVLKLFTTFVAMVDGAVPYAGLTLSGSTLYGTTKNGGTNDSGTIFKVNTDGTGFAVLKHFTGSDGAAPYAGLTLSGSILYGTTKDGGTNDSGTIFKVNTDGTGFTVLIHFNGSGPNGNGNRPYAGLTLSDSTLYGATQAGGANGAGTVFRVNTDGTGFTVLKSFSYSGEGQGPTATLTLSGSKLYGTTEFGGNHDVGTVFKMNTDGTGFAVLKSLGEINNPPEGEYPRAGLTLSGDTLYGVAQLKGRFYGGTVFKIFTDGMGFTTLKGLRPIDGQTPTGGLVAWGSALYGTTFQGGISGSGTLFKVNTDGTGYTVLKDFFPGNELIPDAGVTLLSDGLYGTTWTGGNYGGGTLFKMNTDGTDYNVLKHFSYATDGANPRGDLTLSGSTLYGTTLVGTNSGQAGGTVFKMNTDGSGFTVLKVFELNSDGQYPQGALVLSGSTLYGTTYEGGSLLYGTVFKVNTDGTGFTELKNFAYTNGMYPDGYHPRGGLTLSGSTLYGTTIDGGTNNTGGTIFKVNTDGTGFAVLKHYDGGSDGASPYGDLTLSGDALYGTTRLGGGFGGGTVFKINTDGTGYTVLKSFYEYNTDGYAPYAGVTLSGDTLFGTTSGGGSNNAGTVFKVKTDGSGFRVIQHLSLDIGRFPYFGVQVANGVIYGTTSDGGLDGGGVVFRIRYAEANAIEPNPTQFGGTVAMQLTPIECVTNGAQWRVNGGAWLNSGEDAANVPPGSQMVEFKPVVDWITPKPVTVRVVGNHSISNAAAYAPLASVNVGPINFSNSPVGPLPGADSGRYIQANTISTNAPEPFNNTNRITRSVRVSGKTVIFQAGHTNGLYDAYNENDDLKDLSIHAETLIVRSPLRLPQTAVTLYARELQFEGAEAWIDTTPRSLTSRPAGATPSTPAANGTDGLKAGDITVYVEELTSYPVLPNRFILNGGSGQPGGLGLNGNAGLSKPTYGDYYNCPKPDNATAIKVVESYYLCELILGCIPLALPPFYNYEDVWYWPSEGFFDDPEAWKPTNGQNARPGGKPGNGGTGGAISGSLRLVDYTDSWGGTSATATYSAGGDPGTPQPAYKMRDKRSVNYENILGIPVLQGSSDNWYGIFSGDVFVNDTPPYPKTHISQTGQDANSPVPDFALGPQGLFYTAGHALSWLSPYALRMVLTNAADAFLAGHLDDADEVLVDYETLLTGYQTFPEWQQLSNSWQMEFTAMLLEIQTLRQRIANHPANFGSVATLTASGSGSPPLAYQWLFNGAQIAGATNASLTLSNLTFVNQGNYQVIVTNAYGSVTSSVAIVTVNPPAGYNRLQGELLSNGDVRLSFIGEPGLGYALDRTISLAPPAWVPQATNPAGADGVLIFTNTPDPNTNNYWRTRAVP